jgi:ribosome-binding factor A
MSKRLARINEQLKREISQVLRREVRDPRVGVVTVSAVDVAADLAVADVYIRMLGSGEEVARSLEGLETAAPFVRRELGKVLHLRQIPELRFREDRSLEHARRIEEILSRVLPGDGDVEEGSDDGDAGPEGGDEGGAA